MIISNNQINEVLRVYRQQAVKGSRAAEQIAAPAASKKTDSVEISAQGQEISRVKKYLDQVPEIREDLVNELKEKVEKGTYTVSGQEVAEKMIGRNLVDKLI